MNALTKLWNNDGDTLTEIDDNEILEINNLPLDEPSINCIFFLDEGECAIKKGTRASTNDSHSIEYVSSHAHIVIFYFFLKILQ